MEKGRVYWITGLSGAGKTTVGGLLYRELKQIKDNVVLLDGDALRRVFGNDLGYSAAERHTGAYRNARISKMLADQGVDVVCCTISMFDDVREWNRSQIERYMEIYLKVSLRILKERDQKGLYSALEKGEVEDLAGIDLEVELPKKPDMTIQNDGEHSPERVVDNILRSCGGIR